MRVGIGIAAATVVAAGLVSCASAPVEPAHPDFTGVWSGYLTTPDNPYWRIADLNCFAGCPAVMHARVTARAADPAIASRPPDELRAEDQAFQAELYPGVMTAAGLATQRVETAEDLETYCEPYGLLREAINPLPVLIREEGDALIFEYEEWVLTRTVYMDGRAPPADVAPSPLGWSAGRYEGDALVVESTAIAGDYYPGRTGRFSDEAAIVERYVIHEDPRRLVVELTITDPVTLKAPFVWTKTWLHTPEVELILDACEGVPGQL